jgi:hypothetical protein
LFQPVILNAVKNPRISLLLLLVLWLGQRAAHALNVVILDSASSSPESPYFFGPTVRKNPVVVSLKSGEQKLPPPIYGRSTAR